MAKVKVAVIRGQDPYEMLQKALELVNCQKKVTQEDEVLIKPNYVVAKHPSTGITTDTRIVEGIIAYLKNLGINKITIGEGGAGNTEKAFDVVGIRNVVKRYNAKLIDLNRDKTIIVKIPDALALNEVGVAETALKSTCIINVPKLKVHHMALVTLSMKNLMGLILPKNIMHSMLNEKIVDLAMFFKEKVKLNIVDGLVGSEEDEVHGSPVQMNLIIAGEDMVAVDAVSAAVMGIDPNKVRYLKLAEERGVGTANLKDIEIVGETIDKVKRKFKLPLAFRE